MCKGQTGNVDRKIAYRCFKQWKCGHNQQIFLMKHLPSERFLQFRSSRKQSFDNMAEVKGHHSRQSNTLSDEFATIKGISRDENGNAVAASKPATVPKLSAETSDSSAFESPSYHTGGDEQIKKFLRQEENNNAPVLHTAKEARQKGGGVLDRSFSAEADTPCGTQSDRSMVKHVIAENCLLYGTCQHLASSRQQHPQNMSLQLPSAPELDNALHFKRKAQLSLKSWAQSVQSSKPSKMPLESDTVTSHASTCCQQPKSVRAFPDMVADASGCVHERFFDVEDSVSLLEDAETSYEFPVSENSTRCEMTLGKTILVTGGAGYIGSHSVIELVEAGYDIVVIDNLVNASMESIRRVEKIVGKPIASYSVDLLDKPAIEEVFNKHSISAVIHFAGLKAVGESCELPLLYYKINVGGTTNLLEVMEKHNVYNLVFSSSATVYGKPQFLPLTEDHPVGGCTNPYGKTKFMIENILQDLSASNKKWNIVILRYFNPVGSHKSGTIGEDPQGVPNNLMPYIAQVAVGRRECLTVYGSDYDTPDGTGVRDYIHVVDLAQGHVAAVKKLDEDCGLKIYNLGTGQGYSVLDMVKAFEKASGKKIPYQLADRRAGDVASCYSDPSLAARELGWTAKRGLDEMCEDLWRWQSQNPQGFNTPSS